MTYEELEDFIVNTLDLQPEDFDSYDEYLEAIELKFKQHYNYGVENVTSDIWNTRIDDYDSDEDTPVTSLKEAIKSIMQKQITKREQTVQVLETADKPFSVKEFVEETGMNKNTARRELGQGVKKGLFERVSRGVYRRL